VRRRAVKTSRSRGAWMCVSSRSIGRSRRAVAGSRASVTWKAHEVPPLVSGSWSQSRDGAAWCKAEMAWCRTRRWVP